MALFSGHLQSLFTGVAFFSGPLQRCAIGVHMQATALAIDQQRRARRQQQHGRTGTDQCRNTERPGNDRTVGSSAAASGEDACHASRVQTRNVGWTDFVHHQNVRLLGFARGFYSAKRR